MAAPTAMQTPLSPHSERMKHVRKCLMDDLSRWVIYMNQTNVTSVELSDVALYIELDMQ